MSKPLELLKLNQEYFVLKRAVRFTFKLSDLKDFMPKEAYFELIGYIDYPSDKPFEVTVPRGYISDLQTLPDWFTNRFNVKSKYRRAFLLQDFLYEVIANKCAEGDGISVLDQMLTKRISDAFALAALKSLGMGWLRRKVLGSVFKRTAVDKGERKERRGLVTFLLKHQHRIGLSLKQRTVVKGPGEPIIIKEPYRVFNDEGVGTELRLSHTAILQYPNITIPLYLTK